MTLHPQYLVDRDGKPLSVLLPITEFEALLSAQEDAEDLQAAMLALREIETGEGRPLSLTQLDEYLADDLDR